MKIIFWVNKHSIYCRITVNGKRVEISTGLLPRIGNTLRNGRTGDSITDTRLAEIEFKLRKAELVLSMTGNCYDALDVKEQYLNSQPKAPKVYRILDVMADKDRIYKATTSKLKAFLGKKNPKLKDLDQNFIEGFAKYLDKTLSRSSVKTYLSKVFASIALNVDEIPFVMPELLPEPTSKNKAPKHLSLEQFEKIKYLQWQQKINYLNCFVWQCYTGMAMIDMNKFDGKLDTMISGEKVLRYVRAKTGVEAIIPASKEMETLLLELPFPFELTERSYNNALKKLGNKVDFDNMTSHNGRHTFAVLKLIEGFSMESCKKMLGHSSIRMTESIYARVTVEKLLKEQKQNTV